MTQGVFDAPRRPGFFRRWLRRGLITGGLLLLLAAIPIVWVETACQSPRAPVVAGKRPPINAAPPWKRELADSYLSYPEWYIVHAYEDLAGVMKTQDEADFRYVASIRGFWSSLCTLTQTATRYGPVSGEWKATLYIIGLSFSVEMAIKGAYESTIGWLTAWWRGPDKTAEDRFALALAQDYAKFLRQTPWYEYPFWRSLQKFWIETPWEGDNWVRKGERRFALTLEWGVKSVYAQVLAKLAGIAPADLRLRSVVRGLSRGDMAVEPRIKVLQSLPDFHMLIETPRYRQFTEIALGLVQRDGVFTEIAGNNRVLITVLARTGFAVTVENVDPVFSYPLQARPGWQRSGLDIPVSALGRIMAQLGKVGGEVEHVYDY